MAEMDVNEVLAHLPQRYPMIMVDRVKECEPGKRIVAIKNVSANEPFFPGHFPHRPIMPGVLILEAMAQTAGVLVFRSRGTMPDDKTVYYYVGIDNARFKKPVLPGDQLEIEVHFERQLRGIAKFNCSARVDGQVVAEATILCSMQSIDEMSAEVHPSAVVHPGARLAKGTVVGPYSLIGAKVEIGEGSWIGAHVVLDGRLRIGRNNQIFHFASLGAPPQDKKYGGEDTAVEIGDGNTIREYVTINRGTALDVGVTRVGNDNWIMAYVHFAHDCQIGSHTVFANACQLAGHVTVGDWAIFGATTLVHQFVHIGAHAFTGMGTYLAQDLPPFVKAAGNMAQPYGINSEGLKRRGFSPEAIAGLKRAYRTLYRSGLGLEEARQALEAQVAQCSPVRDILEFLHRSKRGIIR